MSIACAHPRDTNTYFQRDSLLRIISIAAENPQYNLNEVYLK